MKKSPYCLNVFLVIVVGGTCLLGSIVRGAIPGAVLPRVSLPLLVLLSLIALTAERYLAEGNKRAWIPTVLLAGVTFALLPWCAGLTGGVPVWKLFAAGAAVFGVTTALYDSIGRRMASASAAKLAPVAHALGLYLASQCLQGFL